MALFIVSLDTRLHIEASDEQSAKQIAYDVLAPSEFDAYEADENDTVRHESKCRPWARSERGGVTISPRTCNEIVEAAARERERLEQEQEAADA